MRSVSARLRFGVQQGAKVAALLATSALLIATSPAPDCDKWTAPVTFQATGTCGPGGLVVASADGTWSSVALANAAALGLPPLESTSSPSAYGRYAGKACPFTLEKGDWYFEWYSCPQTSTSADGGSADASADAAVHSNDGSTSDAGTGAPVSGCVRRCDTLLVAGELRFTCSNGAGQVTCESRLVKVTP